MQNRTVCQGALVLHGRRVPYALTYKKVKNVNIRVRADGTVAVSANRWVSQTQVEAILAGKADFILKALERFAALEQMTPGAMTYQPGDTLWFLGKSYPLEVRRGTQNKGELTQKGFLLTVKDPGDEALRTRTMEAFYRDQCLGVTARLVRQFQPVLQPLGVPVPEIKVRSMTSRWGSCLATWGKVTLNRRLFAFPPDVVDYVLCHEYCHLLEPDHQEGFRSLLHRMQPRWREYDAVLREEEYRFLR